MTEQEYKDKIKELEKKNYELQSQINAMVSAITVASRKLEPYKNF